MSTGATVVMQSTTTTCSASPLPWEASASVSAVLSNVRYYHSIQLPPHMDHTLKQDKRVKRFILDWVVV